MIHITNKKIFVFVFNRGFLIFIIMLSNYIYIYFIFSLYIYIYILKNRKVVKWPPSKQLNDNKRNQTLQKTEGKGHCDNDDKSKWRFKKKITLKNMTTAI